MRHKWHDLTHCTATPATQASSHTHPPPHTPHESVYSNKRIELARTLARLLHFNQRETDSALAGIGVLPSDSGESSFTSAFVGAMFA